MEVSWTEVWPFQNLEFKKKNPHNSNHGFLYVFISIKNGTLTHHNWSWPVRGHLNFWTTVNPSIEVFRAVHLYKVSAIIFGSPKKYRRLRSSVQCLWIWMEKCRICSHVWCQNLIPGLDPWWLWAAPSISAKEKEGGKPPGHMMEHLEAMERGHRDLEPSPACL